MGFGAKPRERKHSLSLQDFRDSQGDVMSGAAGFRDSDVIIADLDYNAIIGFNTIIFRRLDVQNFFAQLRMNFIQFFHYGACKGMILLGMR